MASTDLSQVGYGFNARDVYSHLRSEAEARYGHREGYSGAINSASGYTEVRIAAKSVDSTKLVPLNQKGTGIDYNFLNKLGKYEEELLDKFDKFRGLACVNLGIVQYVKITFKSRTLSKRVFDRYTLYASDGRCLTTGSDLSYLSSKAESHIYSTGCSAYIAGTLKNGTSVIVKQYEVKKVMTRRKPQNMAGCLPMYAYWFVGWVSC